MFIFVQTFLTNQNTYDGSHLSLLTEVHVIAGIQIHYSIAMIYNYDRHDYKPALKHHFVPKVEELC